MSYVSTADINAYLGTSGEDTLIATLNKSAEIMLNNLIGTDGLASATYTEKFNYPTFTDNRGFFAGQIFYVSQVNPTAVNKIDGTSISSSDYDLTGQKVFLKTALTFNQTFPYKNSIEYVAGFVTIPDDIKQAIYMIVGALYNTRNAQGIDSFSQDLLRVTYSKANSLIDIMNPASFSALSSIINKYKIPFVISSGPDRTTYV